MTDPERTIFIEHIESWNHPPITYINLPRNVNLYFNNKLLTDHLPAAELARLLHTSTDSLTWYDGCVFTETELHDFKKQRTLAKDRMYTPEQTLRLLIAIANGKNRHPYLHQLESLTKLDNFKPNTELIIHFSDESNTELKITY